MKISDITRLAELQGLLDHVIAELTDTVDDIEDTYVQRRLQILLRQLEKEVDSSEE